MYFNEDQYWGRLLKVFTNDEENNNAERVEIKLLRKKCEAWDFPSKEDQQIIESKLVFMGPCKRQNSRKLGTFLMMKKLPYCINI